LEFGVWNLFGFCNLGFGISAPAVRYVVSKIYKTPRAIDDNCPYVVIWIMESPLRSQEVSLTFDDVLLQPGYAGFSRASISLETKLTKKISLASPLVSAPMDTVTESKLAIRLAEAGGIGIIHRNLSVSAQKQEVAKVKRLGLLVGAAIGSSSGYEERVEGLAEVGTDVIVIDSAHGHSQSVIDTIKDIKKRTPSLQVIGGNIASEAGASALIDAGADGLRVGMGPGAICTTRIVSGMGVPQFTALLETAKAARSALVPIIADGGIRYSGDVVKALAAGASTVMLGSIFASTTESPGKRLTLPGSKVPSRFKSILRPGVSKYLFKAYRGMGSAAAMKEGARVKSEDEFHGKSYKDRVLVAEGVEGLVPVTGTVRECVDQLLGGVRSGMYYVGAQSVTELWEKARFAQITAASLGESHPHDILVTDPGKSYS
jgi:IMP dehydrogenase